MGACRWLTPGRIAASALEPCAIPYSLHGKVADDRVPSLRGHWAGRPVPQGHRAETATVGIRPWLARTAIA